MEHAKLIVHRGAIRVTRAELADIAAPPATATWKPIPHATLVSAIHEELTHRNIAVVQEDYAVQRNKSMLFGADGPQLSPDRRVCRCPGLSPCQRHERSREDVRRRPGL